jgi:hypothetical protein
MLGGELAVTENDFSLDLGCGEEKFGGGGHIQQLHLPAL